MSQRLLQEWALQWRGTGATFAIVPVVPSKERRRWRHPHRPQPNGQSVRRAQSTRWDSARQPSTAK